MTLPAFTLNWDYRCPFARNAHEHLISALEDGAGYEVTFLPFSLNQVHVGEGDPPIWDLPEAAPDLLALRVGVTVRDRYPDQFLVAHRELFSARHDHGGDLRERSVVASALERSKLSSDEVLAQAEAPEALDLVRTAHEEAVAKYSVFGVPTFVVGERAAFLRITTRPGGDTPLARRTIEHVVTLIADSPEINELKHTTIAR